MGVFNPQRLNRGDIQQQAFDRPEDEHLVNALEKIRPGFRKDLLRAQESQADALKSAAQRPEADSIDNDSSPFQSNRDLFPSSVVNQIRGEKDISAAAMKPANVTPGAKQVAKGGNISDETMNVGAVGHQIGAQGSGTTTRQVAGRQNFYRAKFYGR